MDLSDIFKVICLVELLIVLVVGSILIHNCVPLSNIIIFYSAGFVLNFILYCLALFLKS